MSLICGLLSLSETRFLNLRHISHILLAFGNGYSPVYLHKYALSKSVVCGLSFKLLELCPLHPITFMIPLSASMSARLVVDSSRVSTPVCSSIVNITEYFHEDAEITLYIFSVVGIRGIFLSYLNLGFSNVKPLADAKFL